MELLDFLNEYEDWDILRASPYFLTIKKYEKYIFITTDNNNYFSTISRQANGAIFRKEKNKYICVNYCFPHAFNPDEDSMFNWASAETYSHIDGLIVCAWNDYGKWHFSTNKYFNIADIKCDNGMNGYELLKEVCEGNITNLTTDLSPEYCYTFILTSPYYKTIANYGNNSQLWYISRRNSNLIEDRTVPLFKLPIQIPHHFERLRAPFLLKELCKIITENEVGYISVDKYGNRIKFDGEAYLEQKNINLLDTKQIIELWQKNKLDKYASNKAITLIKNCLQFIINEANNKFEELKLISNNDRKIFMRKLPQHLPCTSAYLVERWLGGAKNAEQFFKEANPNDLMVELQYKLGRRNQ